MSYFLFVVLGMSGCVCSTCCLLDDVCYFSVMLCATLCVTECLFWQNIRVCVSRFCALLVCCSHASFCGSLICQVL